MLSKVITADFLEWKTDMKFDVVIGNPPFQDKTAKSSKKLWPEFIKTGFGLLTSGGYIAVISPASWLAGKSDIFDLIAKNQCVYLDGDASAHFPGIGSTFSVIIVQNAVRTSATKSKNGLIINFTGLTALPRLLTTESLSIFNKVTTKNPLDIQFDSFCHSQRTDRISADQSPIFCYPNRHGAESVVWSNVQHPVAKKKKVMFYMSGNPKPFYDGGHSGISEHHGYILCNKKDSVNLITYLESKLIRFVITYSTFAQAWNKIFIKKISAIDLTKSWTDKALYKHFKLTPEEIAYVEANVK